MNKFLLILLTILPSFLFTDNFYSIKLNKGFQSKAYTFTLGEKESGAYMDFDTIGLVFDVTPVKKFGLWGNLGVNYLLNLAAIGTDLTGVKNTSETDLNYSLDLNLGFAYTSKSKISKLQFCIGPHLNWINIEDDNSSTAGIGGQYSMLFPIKGYWLNVSLISNYDFYEVYSTYDDSLDFVASYMAGLQIGIGF